MPADSYDGVILGTGHNALVLQAYLCRCGLRVVSLDRAELAGGGLATAENPRHPGHLHNTHSFFHRGMTHMPWYADLELHRHGARYLEPELNVAMLLRDGRSLQWWTDLNKTIESFSQFSPRDAQTLAHWATEFQPIVERILIPEAASPPLPARLRQSLLERSSLGRRLLEVSQLSPLEFVEREFEHTAVRAGLLFFNGLREVDLRLRGFGHSIPALLAGGRMAQMCVGGSAKLADALVEDIREHGGDVLLGGELKSILICEGRAAGVELADGEQIIAARFVASGLNPQQTFLDLLPEDAVPAGVRRKAGNFQYNLLAPLFGLNVALTEPPNYSAAANQDEVNRAFMVILGLERFEQFHEIVAAHEQSRFPETVMWGTCPTLFDSSQAPMGRHTAFMWEKLPYRAFQAAADPRKLAEEHAEAMLRLWTEYAPNLSGSAVVDLFARSPLDTERDLPNMVGGDLLVGSFANGQIGENRPFPGAGNYRTPISGLYLCGGSTHPGGNITGLCGYNAAAVIAADSGCDIWWDRPDIEQQLRSL